MHLETLLPAFVEYVGKKLVDKYFSSSHRAPRETLLEERIQSAIKAHVGRVNNWSSSVGFYRMPATRPTDEETIPLLFSATPRRFRATAESGRVLTESELLKSGHHVLILGAPGAGKTTTLKRLARMIFTQESAGEMDTFQVPLLIRLRDLDTSQSQFHPLLVAIAKEIGLKVRVPEEKISVDREYPDGSRRVEERVVQGRPVCEEVDAGTVVPQVVNQLNPILLLDGLDECTLSIRAAVEEDIQLLLENSQTFRIVMTCRSGEYTNPLGNMNVIEVCDLREKDVAELSNRWLGPERTEDFLQKVRNTSLAELSTRPLFLSHMLVIFEIDGSLPEQPYELYELIVMLMIREWDRERKIHRKSRYADFGPEKKRRFLAAIAFHLTYKATIKTFTENDLVGIYRLIYNSFGLPADEAREVVVEIESHTGLISEAGRRHFEFSHLTLQEYLCAEHLVRSPFPAAMIGRFISINPAPLAIATALSADPSAWLAAILLNDALINASMTETIDQRLGVFLDRLTFENPIFASGTGLGLCIVALCFRQMDPSFSTSRARVESYMTNFLSNSAARNSFIDAITTSYRVMAHPSDHRIFVATRNENPSLGPDALDELPTGYTPPPGGRISRAWLETNFTSALMLDAIRISKRH